MSEYKHPTILEMCAEMEAALKDNPMSDTLDLKMCPFCGGIPVFFRLNETSKFFGICCNDCRCGTPLGTDQFELGAIWNKRPATDEEIESALYEASKKFSW